MKKAQICLPEDLYKNLAIEANRQKTTISGLIQLRIISKPFLTKGNSKKILLDLIEKGEQLSWKRVPKDLSKKIDGVVYG